MKVVRPGLFTTLVLVGCGPIVMVPGGELSGTTTPVPADWAFSDAVETVQLETRPDDPYSVNVWGVSDGAFHPTDPNRAWVIARDPTVGTAAYQTEDGGRSFSPVPDVPGDNPGGVRFGVDGTAWLAAGGDVSSHDGTWTTTSATPAEAHWILDVDPTDPLRLWVVHDPDSEVDRVFQTDDAGATWFEVPGIDGEVADQLEDREWL